MKYYAVCIHPGSRSGHAQLSYTTYLDACNINEKVTGRKISQQTWAISFKIKQMDDFLSETNAAGLVREFHPEVAFWALNNKVEMQYNKKLQQGHEERLKVVYIQN